MVGWSAGRVREAEVKTNSAQLKLEMGLSLAKIFIHFLFMISEIHWSCKTAYFQPILEIKRKPKVYL